MAAAAAATALGALFLRWRRQRLAQATSHKIRLYEGNTRMIKAARIDCSPEKAALSRRLTLFATYPRRATGGESAEATEPDCTASQPAEVDVPMCSPERVSEKTAEQPSTPLTSTFSRTRSAATRMREWEKARARVDAAAVRAEAARASGVESLADASKRMLEERRQREEAERTRNGDDATEAASAAVVPPEAIVIRRRLTGPTEATIAAELQRWPSPPSGAATDLEEHSWPLYYDHCDWIEEVAEKYSFTGAAEVLRHLVFIANTEPPQMKKFIFMSIRCLHCHAGAGSAGGGIPKKEKVLPVFGFQLLWLRAVQERSAHSSVEKTVRIICDYYRKTTSERPANEAELFWRNRHDVTARR